MTTTVSTIEPHFLVLWLPVEQCDVDMDVDGKNVQVMYSFWPTLAGHELSTVLALPSSLNSAQTSVHTPYQKVAIEECR